MANILITFYQPIFNNDPMGLLCFYDSLSLELKKHGNNVFMINVASIKKDYYQPQINDKINVINQVKDFSPDLLIAFNHQIFEGLIENIDCQIVVWDADAYELFSCKTLFQQNITKYTMLTLCSDWCKRYENIGFKKENIHYIPIATSVQKENIDQNKNISIIASRFGYNNELYDKFDTQNKRGELNQLYISYCNKPNYNYEKIYKDILSSDLPKCSDESHIYQFFDIRNLTLIYLLDLGLCLYGRGWEVFKDSLPQLFCSYNSTPAYSLKHNQNIYNTSKICLSVNHPQNKGYAFPWRIFDIMASNGCLISSYSMQLKRETKGFVDIPMFHTPIEARELCIKYLKEENLRKELIEASQKFVEKKARWCDRFEILEDILNIKLIVPHKEGTIKFLKSMEIEQELPKKIQKKLQRSWKSLLKEKLKTAKQFFS